VRAVSFTVDDVSSSYLSNHFLALTVRWRSLTGSIRQENDGINGPSNANHTVESYAKKRFKLIRIIHGIHIFGFLLEPSTGEINYLLYELTKQNKT